MDRTFALGIKVDHARQHHEDQADQYRRFVTENRGKQADREDHDRLLSLMHASEASFRDAYSEYTVEVLGERGA